MRNYRYSIDDDALDALSQEMKNINNDMFRPDPFAQLTNELQIERDNTLYEIEQNTDLVGKQIKDANQQILILTKQLDDVRSELKTTREQCDLVNRQFLQYQIDEGKRDKSSGTMDTISIIVAILSMLVAVISLFC